MWIYIVHRALQGVLVLFLVSLTIFSWCGVCQEMSS
jgi:hypothetical protein